MSLPDAPRRLRDIATGFRDAQVLLSAVELGVFTVLADGALDGDALQRRLAVAPRGARDFFDALVALGLLARTGDWCYANTPDADRYLDSRKPDYVGGEFAFFHARLYPHWHRLLHALRTGEPQRVSGASGYFQSIYADASQGLVFAAGMTAGTLLVARELAAVFPWSRHHRLVDVGSAQGAFPVEILRAHPHLTGVGFDLPEAGPLFERYVAAHGLAPRLAFAAGDFHRDPLPQADVMVMGRVLHNWDLATKQMLLRKAHAALAPGGSLLVYERLIDDDRRGSTASLLGSLNMLLMTDGGFDFTAADCISWMHQAGFRDARSRPLCHGIAMVLGTR
jgi:hypothetical protein